MVVSPLHPAFIAAFAGVVTQRILSPIQEVPTAKFLGACLAANATILVIFLFRLSTPILAALRDTVLINTAFFTSLITTTIIYRVFFHPLRKFPGPRLAAVSKLWEVNENFHGRRAAQIRALHKKHGDFLRTGPHEMAINNVDAIPKLLGRSAPSKRGAYYELGSNLAEERNVLGARDKQKHADMRRHWDVAMNGPNTNSYSPRVEYHVNKLISIMDGINGRESNLVDLMENFTFDVMADLGFGHESQMQEGLGDPTMMSFLHDWMRALAVFGALRNLCDLVPYLPEDPATKIFRQKGLDMLAARQKKGKTIKDIFTYLSEEDEETGTKMNQGQLYTNTQLIIVAGSDTTSVALVDILRMLALLPEKQRALQAELDAAFSKEDEINVESTKDLKYLNGVVNEGLRMFTPIPPGAQVITAEDGVTIDSVYIPGSTTVRVYPYTLQRDERYFPRGDEFLPERWVDRPDLIQDVRAYIPFSYGPHACAGKHLALNELRLVVARIAQRFDIQLGKSYNNAKFEEEAKDYFVVKHGDCPMRFVSRKN